MKPISDRGHGSRMGHSERQRKILRTPEVQAAIKAWRADRNPKNEHILRSALVKAGAVPGREVRALMHDLFGRGVHAGNKNEQWGRYS